MHDFFLRQVLLLLAPVGFLWLCLIVLTVALWLRKQHRFAVGAACLVLFVTIVGSSGLPASLVAALEKPYAGKKPDELPECDAVVMLGGGVEPSRYEVGGLHLTKAGDRVLMALELMRLGKAPVLVIGGAAATLDGTLRVEADLTGQWVADWQLSLAPVISLGRCVNTRDEAVKVRALADARGWRRVLLVTSANHMRRAVAVFHKAGVEAVPAPCNFLTEISTPPGPPGWNIPSYGGFEKVSIWLHEQIGWVIYSRRGWL